MISSCKCLSQSRRASGVFLPIGGFDEGHFLSDSSGNGYTLVNHGAKQIDGTAQFDGKAILNTVDSIDLSVLRTDPHQLAAKSGCLRFLPSRLGTLVPISITRPAPSPTLSRKGKVQAGVPQRRHVTRR